MRICYIADASNSHTQKWVGYFAARGHKVCMASYRPIGKSAVDLSAVELHLFPAVRTPFKLTSYAANLVSNVRLTRRVVKDFKPDVVHAHYVSAEGFLGALSGHHPLVISAWGSDILVDPGRGKLTEWKVRYALKKADAITCDGDNSVKRLKELGARPDKIALILHGVDVDKFRRRGDTGRLAARLGLNNHPVVISTRNLNPMYDVESLIRAVPLVLKLVPEAGFIIAGEGEQRPWLQDLAGSLGVSGSIRFVGYVDQTDMPVYLSLASVYVSTSLSDGGVAISTLEAMACELPAVVTDSGDNAEWIASGENGFLIPLKNPEKVADAITQLIKDDDLRNRAGRTNRRLVEDNSNYEREMQKMEAIYEQLVQGVRN